MASISPEVPVREPEKWSLNNDKVKLGVTAR